MVPPRRPVHQHPSRANFRHRGRRRGDRRSSASRHRARSRAAADPGCQAGGRVRRPALGRTAHRGAGARAPPFRWCPDHRRRHARHDQGSGRRGPRRARGAALHGGGELADGGRKGTGGVGQFHHRTTDGDSRRRGLRAYGRGAAHRCRGDSPTPLRWRHRARLSPRLLSDGRGLQPPGRGGRGRDRGGDARRKARVPLRRIGIRRPRWQARARAHRRGGENPRDGELQEGRRCSRRAG